MNLENIKAKLSREFSEYYGEEGLTVIKDYCEDGDEFLYFIISDILNRSHSKADSVLLNIIKNKLKINEIDKDFYNALHGKLIEVSNKNIISNIKPFDYINKYDPVIVSKILQQENPQAIALILSFLETEKTAILLQNLPGELQGDVAMRISKIDAIETEAIRNTEKAFEEKLMAMLSKEPMIPSGGIDMMTEILKLVDRQTRRQIIERMKDDDSELAEKIGDKMFVFDDIVKLDDRAIQKVMREVDSSELAFALKSVKADVKNKIFSNMSKRAASMLKEDMDYMGPVRLADVENAQKKIIAIIRHLEDVGEIVIAIENDEIIDDDPETEKAVKYGKRRLPYETYYHLLLYSKKEIFENMDNETLAISIYGMALNYKTGLLKNLSYKKRKQVKKILDNLEEIWYDDICNAQEEITEILKENFDENDERYKKEMKGEMTVSVIKC